MELFELNRFVEAQESFNTYETALKEVKEGAKRSHWIWYIFPQIDGMGHSSTSKRYGIKSLLEAKAYFENDYLRDHLYKITNALLEQDDSAQNIFGALDAMKVRSCMTLFNIVSPDDVFAEVLTKFYESNVCRRTLEIVEKELTAYKGDSAFVRNGIRSQEKAFFEDGSHESNQYSHKQKMATILDLVSRRDSMLSMVQYYFWNKDIGIYRVSGVELTVHMYLENLINEFIVDLKDESLIKAIHEFWNAIPYEDCNVFDWAKAYDAFYKKFHKNPDVKAAFDVILKESLCKPMEKKAIAREYNDEERPMFTPGKLSSLKDDEIFVFGSNLAGAHGGGAARAAMMRFGAVWGQGVGLQGQSYAIPTMQGGVDTIKPYVDDFIDFARNHTELFFYVTRIGCGIAGFKDEDIAPLFAEALDVENICLPKSFFEVLKPVVPKELIAMMYGQVHTMVDLLKSLNVEKPIKGADDAYDRLQEIMERNVRYGDEYAFMALRTIWCLMSKYQNEGDCIDIAKLEEDMMNFHKDNFFGEVVAEQVLYNYSVAKMIKYIQFVNEFKRFKSYREIEDILPTIGFSHCSENDPNYYYSFNRYAAHRVYSIMYEEWQNITKNGILDNDAFEDVMFGRFERMVKKFGVKETIRRGYGQVGCHPDIQAPIGSCGEQTPWGPIYNIHEDGRIEKGCNDFRRYPWTNTSFEMKFAYKLLDEDPHYKFVEGGWRGGYYVPIEDMSLPVYSKHGGKLEFQSNEDKQKAIKQILNTGDVD